MRGSGQITLGNGSAIFNGSPRLYIYLRSKAFQDGNRLNSQSTASLSIRASNLTKVLLDWHSLQEPIMIITKTNHVMLLDTMLEFTKSLENAPSRKNITTPLLLERYILRPKEFDAFLMAYLSISGLAWSSKFWLHSILKMLCLNYTWTKMILVSGSWNMTILIRKQVHGYLFHRKTFHLSALKQMEILFWDLKMYAFYGQMEILQLKFIGVELPSSMMLLYLLLHQIHVVSWPKSNAEAMRIVNGSRELVVKRVAIHLHHLQIVALSQFKAIVQMQAVHGEEKMVGHAAKSL